MTSSEISEYELKFNELKDRYVVAYAKCNHGEKAILSYVDGYVRIEIFEVSDEPSKHKISAFEKMTKELELRVSIGYNLHEG